MSKAAFSKKSYVDGDQIAPLHPSPQMTQMIPSLLLVEIDCFPLRLAKKPKKNHLQSRPAFNPKPVPTSSVSSSTLSTSSCAATTTSTLTSRAEPWNRKQFLQRLSTFANTRWHIRRTDVTPLICARFGWQCVGRNSLECTGCGTKVTYPTNKSCTIWTREMS